MKVLRVGRERRRFPSKFGSMVCVTLGMMAASARAQTLPVLRVGPGAGQYRTVGEAVAAAPASGAVVRIAPGVYREVVHIDKPNMQLRGEGGDARAVEIVYANGASNTCGTSCSATVFVTGDGFVATGLTIANDWRSTGKPRTQGVALSISGDRAVLRDVRLLGAQDTLLADSKGCRGAAGAAPVACRISRQYYDHCYIEGEVDFIFGNAKAVFHECEIHSVTYAEGYLTAHGRSRAEEDSGYVFDRCRLTAEPGVEHVYLGRPWRDYARVVYLNTEMGAHIDAAGWREWHPGETERLKTAWYGEYGSSGPGAHAGEREGLAKALTAEEAKQFGVKAWLGGVDGWDPTAVK